MTLEFINEYLETIKNRNKIYNLITLILSDRKKFNDIDTYILFGTFKQKLYHYINQSKDFVKCSVCSNHTKWLEKSFLYTETCSPNCSGKLNKRINKNSRKNRTYPIFDNSDELLNFLYSGKIILSKSVLSKNYPEIMINYNNEPIQKYLYDYFYEGSIKCKCCNKDSKFISFNIGYEKYCSNLCEQFDKTKNITLSSEVFKLHKKSGYYVSNFGRVKGKYQDFLTLTNSNGYAICSPGLLHRIVIETFIGEIPEGMQIDHIDGNKSNNYLSNLEIVTKSENQKRKYKNLSLSKKIDGEKNPMSKLTEEDVLKMYEMFKENKTDKEIAVLYGLHTNYISLVRYGKRWGYLFKSEEMDIHYSFGQTYTKEQMYEVIKMILDGHPNIYIANITKINKDMISRVRHKKVWSKVWETYLKECNGIFP